MSLFLVTSLENGAIKKKIVKKNHAKKTKTSDIDNKNTTNSSQNDIKDKGINLYKKEKGDNEPPITYEGSSEDTILECSVELLNPLQDSRVINNNNNNAMVPSISSKMPVVQEKLSNGLKHYPKVSLSSENTHYPSDVNSVQKIDDICWNVILDMNRFGVCVVNNFLGVEKGESVLREVLGIYDAGLFKDGQLVSNKAGITHTRTIRGDKIVWLDGKEKFCKNIGMLISKVDAIIMRANKMHNNGKLGKYTINGRTKVFILIYIIKTI